MLVHLHNKQRRIASIALSAFIGSWLLLLCQTCLATTDDASLHHEPVSEISDSCHVPDKGTQDNKLDDEHCLGACDCDALTATINTDKNFEIKDKNKLFPDGAVVVSSFNVSNYLLSNTPYFSPPERAKLPPFYTYNVLLI